MTMQKKRERSNTKSETGIGAKALVISKELLYVLIVVLLVNSFVLASFEVPTGSMENTVKVGDRIFVNKFIYGGTTPYAIPLTSIRIPHLRVPGLHNIERGDVVVFDWPGNRDQVEKPKQVFFLKRCIGLPGDTIRIDQRVVYVNGRKLTLPLHGRYLRSEPVPAGYSNPNIFPRGSDFNEDNFGPIAVPRKGMTLSLSANNFRAWEVFIRREGHSASLINNEIQIDGRPATQYAVERDYIFGMGDNRDDSLDSRFWGFIPAEDVIGTPMIVFWSWNPQIPLYHPIDRLLSIDLGRIGTVIR